MFVHAHAYQTKRVYAFIECNYDMVQLRKRFCSYLHRITSLQRGKYTFSFNVTWNRSQNKLRKSELLWIFRLVTRQVFHLIPRVVRFWIYKLRVLLLLSVSRKRVDSISYWIHFSCPTSLIINLFRSSWGKHFR